MNSDDKDMNVKDVQKKPRQYKIANLELLKLVHKADQAGLSYGKFVEKNKL